MQNKDYSYYAIIVAGGKGKRMNQDLPKQFLRINHLPILMHTIKAFHHHTYQPQIILVLAETDVAYWKSLLQQYQFDVPHQIAFGGDERFDSVKNGLDLIHEENAVVAVHDAVRPLVSSETISRCFDTAVLKGNAIAAVASKDSVRRITQKGNEALNRAEIYLIQTPQTFQINQLRKAYKQSFQSHFTDDAAVVEKAGFDISIEKGDQFNFKITFPEDLILAEAILKSRT
ncbi:MAG: 2-C-methyl-D-erythritol 4-phosphate cytidylyltransferase [Sphingobacteriales bacterium]|nr:2-C-methyl-D-erythritol 4-phosphate cytidylyltransferase [Sphingobacteriales bacterium]